MRWNEQEDALKDSVRYFIANQQLSFANGGWCMNDEATTHYMGMIDQTTLGRRFLINELGVIPTVGWQLVLDECFVAVFFRFRAGGDEQMAKDSVVV
jgi:hypothetical protein